MNILKVIAAGRLTEAPDLRALPSGGSVANFTLAINRTYMKGEEKVEQTEFVPVVVFGRLADTVHEYLERGQVALVEGRLQTRSWEKEGVKQYRTEVVADSVQFGAKAGSRKQSSGPETPAEKAQSTPRSAPAKIEYPTEDINPDDIPF